MDAIDDRVYTLDEWQPGTLAWFEYHCWESDDSSDALMWRHSHQQATVVSHDPADHDCLRPYANEDAAYGTIDGRIDAGQPCIYRLRFADGFEWDAFEDELLTDPTGFSRPNPPG